MASSAISAQGSVLAIGTGSGSAKTISAIAPGNPTILTATAHGFANGDVVTLAGLTGADAAALNGLTLSVRNKTTNTFAVEIDTTGDVITAGTGTATSVIFTDIVNIKDFTGFEGTASEIDVTNLESTAKEFRLGLTDPGHFTMNIDYDNTNPGHIALRSKQVSGALAQFKLTLPNTNVVNFNGFVKKFGLQGGVDQVAKTAVEIRISGAVTGLAGT